MKAYTNSLIQLHMTYLAYFDIWEQNEGLYWTPTPERLLPELLDTKQVIKPNVTVEIQLHHSLVKKHRGMISQGHKGTILQLHAITPL